MYIKEKLREILLNSKDGFKFDDSKVVDLNEKVDMFIYWYYKNMVKGKYTNIGEYCVPIEMRNFIEKMAVWYELRYPSYEINRLMPGSGQEGIKVDDVMFKDNVYLNETLGIDNDAKDLEWSEFYNFNTFFKSLPWEEASLLMQPKYTNLVYIDDFCHLHLDSSGFVREIESPSRYINSLIDNNSIKGIHVKDVVALLGKNGFNIDNDNEVVRAINNVDKRNYQLEKMLDAVMYRIIERGGNRIGPRRGLLFAKEFNRNIDIPMMYGVDRSDPGLEYFINEYINAGGNENLICYKNYFSVRGAKALIDAVSISEIIHPKNNNDEKTLIKK